MDGGGDGTQGHGHESERVELGAIGYSIAHSQIAKCDMWVGGGVGGGSGRWECKFMGPKLLSPRGFTFKQNMLTTV